jgi:hypothetical protein
MGKMLENVGHTSPLYNPIISDISGYFWYRVPRLALRSHPPGSGPAAPRMRFPGPFGSHHPAALASGPSLQQILIAAQENMGKWGYVTTAASQETPFVVFDGICSIFKD